MLTNDFASANYGSGYFKYDGSTVSNASYKREFLYSSSSQFPHTVSAVSGLNQIYNSIPRMYNNWSGYANTQDLSFNIQSPTNAQSQANFYPGYKATFKNSYGSSGGNCLLNIDNRQYTSPIDTAIRQTSSIQTTAINQNKYVTGTSNYIELTFDHWSTGSTSQTITVTPTTNNQTYYCYLKGKPVHGSRGLYANYTEYGSYVTLNWNVFNDPDITGYQVWRRVKHNGILNDPVLKATINNRNTTTYTDTDYLVTQSYVDLLMYDVRAIYDPSSNNGWDQAAVVADPNYITFFGQQSLLALMNNENKEAKKQFLSKEIPSELKISNFPNPFNPATTISYSIPSASNVNIALYDITGKKISDLINEMKSAGSYQTKFNANGLASGTYFLVINACNIVQSRKIIFMK
jgi:hypothetical protein